MIVLDIGIILVGVMVGYNPPSIACGLFLFIQGIYIASGVRFYIISRRTKDSHFNTTSAKKQIRFVVHQAIAATTFGLGISFGLKPGIVMFVPPFALLGLTFLLDKVFTKLIEKRRRLRNCRV